MGNNKIIQPKYLGPPSYTQNIKNCNRKSALNGPSPNPIQQYPSNNSSVFALNRKLYRNKGFTGGKTEAQKISEKNMIAIGKQAYKSGLTNKDFLSYTSYNKNDVKTALWKSRSRGCTAPAKKGAIANHYKSGGSSLIVRSGNSTTKIGSTLSLDPDIESTDEYQLEYDRIYTQHNPVIKY